MARLCWSVWFVFLFALKSQIVLALEPLAPLTAAMQPVWQAGTPIEVNVDYDGPLSIPFEC